MSFKITHMKNKNLFVIFFLLSCPIYLIAQDEIIMHSGEVIKSVVKEVGAEEIKYLRWDHQEGPVYTVKKPEIFMIKYASGNKDIFNTEHATTGSSKGPAVIYFYRPKKFAGGSPEIIVGTNIPDEVIVKVHNGAWYRTEYLHFGQRGFVTGIYALNPEIFNYDIQPGKTYYIRCTIKSEGLRMMSQLEMVDENTAKQDMSSLKQQAKSR